MMGLGVGLVMIAVAISVLAVVGVAGFLMPGAWWFGPTVRRGDATEGKRIALTFDDGPNEPWTSRLLDILEETRTPAAFFLVGTNAKRHPELVRRMVADGHIIGNHSYTHSAFGSLSGRLFAEVRLTDVLFQDLIGVWPRFVRPPYGHKTPWFLRSARRSGRVVVMWSLAANDWKVRDSAHIARNIMKRAKSRDIVLLHDGDGTNDYADRCATIGAVRLIIEGLRARGFIFVKLSELVNMPAYHASQPEHALK